MRRGGLFRKIYGFFLLITVGVLAGVAWYGARSLHAFHNREVASDLLVRAQIVARELELQPARTPAEIDAICKDLGRRTRTRITVASTDGRVVGDSVEDPAAMENHANRPEIAAAVHGQNGQAIRYSDTLRRRLMYLAIPYSHDGATAGVVRTSLSLEVIDETLQALLRHIAFGALVLAAVIAWLAWYLTRRITQPLRYMRQAAEQFAQGDLTARIPVPATTELAVLARTMNQMAQQLSARIRTIALQSNEQAAIFESLSEGVVAVDLNQRILRINGAAARLMRIEPDAARGRHILEAVRNVDLQEFLSRALAAPGPHQADIVLHDDDERFIHLQGAALKDVTGSNAGALVVLNDITHLRRLETMRRDFVANVSHELKTPLTALKGCIETLEGGALQDPQQAARFLAMMDRHVQRLEALVDDVLSLSRIEHESERGRIALERAPLRLVVDRVVQLYSERAAARRMRLTAECPADLEASMNPPLLEQAVGNLVDNAIKYSPDGTDIGVRVASADDQVEIRVTDRGPGIEAKHQSRIFERFYRVDPSRQRALGGTGLGLAIVKHTALAHRGSVAVESTPGQGSSFILRIPMA